MRLSLMHSLSYFLAYSFLSFFKIYYYSAFQPSGACLLSHSFITHKGLHCTSLKIHSYLCIQAVIVFLGYCIFHSCCARFNSAYLLSPSVVPPKGLLCTFTADSREYMHSLLLFCIFFLRFLHFPYSARLISPSSDRLKCGLILFGGLPAPKRSAKIALLTGLYP